jgi:hypothetical protein
LSKFYTHKNIFDQDAYLTKKCHDLVYHRAPIEMERQASWYGLAREAIERIGLLVAKNME